MSFRDDRFTFLDMDYASLEELLGLPEEEALRRHFRAINYRRLRQFSGATAAVAFVFLLYRLVEGDYLRMAPPILILGIARWLFSAGQHAYFRRFFHLALGTTVVTLSALLVATAPQLDLGMRIVGILVTLSIPTFRLGSGHTGLLLALVWALALGKPLGAALSNQAALPAAHLGLQSAVTLIALYVSIQTTRSDRSSFLQRFRIASSRDRERLRMRRELDSARQIQLGMLPRHDPKLPQLDIAAVSLPATEVGGDYYEYFPGADSQLCVVVGDVAGHGVASGLLLSGIRSCLHLLHEDRPPPPDILRRLDRMVRQTTDRRMFITLLYALFSPSDRQLIVAAAGHPPLLHYTSGDQRVTEIGQQAPPLGTRLDAVYNDLQVEFQEGDVFLLHTDGLQEMVNQRGDAYGHQRLREKLVRASKSGGSAREIRETLLSDLWNFKGDAEQLDDITLIVLRYSGDRGP